MIGLIGGGRFFFRIGVRAWWMRYDPSGNRRWEGGEEGSGDGRVGMGLGFAGNITRDVGADVDLTGLEVGTCASDDDEKERIVRSVYRWSGGILVMCCVNAVEVMTKQQKKKRTAKQRSS